MANVEQDMEVFYEKVKESAVDLVVNTFPGKILELDRLMKRDKFMPEYCVEVEINITAPDATAIPEEVNSDKVTPTGDRKTKRRKRKATIDLNADQLDDEALTRKPFLFPNGLVDCNPHLIDLVDAIKPLMIQLINDAILLKLGISLMVPKIEDGNNFGVDIQRVTLEVIASIEEKFEDSLDAFGEYFAARAKLIVKVAKFPNCQDYRRAVRERDAMFHLELYALLTDIRNSYASLHDLVVKNLGKIKEPRSERAKEMLY